MSEGRVLSNSVWLSTAGNNPLMPEEPLSKIALDALASVREPQERTLVVKDPHWPLPEEDMLGAMWLGVISPTLAARDEEGCWVIQTNSGVDDGHPPLGYLRLVPAGDGEAQFGFCPMKLNRSSSMIEDLFPGGEVYFNYCPIRPEPSTSIRLDKMAITAARYSEAETTKGRRFRELLGRLQIPLGDLMEDLFRHVYNDRAASILCDRSLDYRDIVCLLVDGAYPGTMLPATVPDVKRFLSCIRQEVQSVWTLETAFPFLGTVVLPDQVIDKVSRNLERGIPPIIPQWATHEMYQFNGPLSRPCTGNRSEGMNCKIIGGVCNTFNTDLPGPLAYWPTNWHPHSGWLQNYMDLLDLVHTTVMPLDVHHVSDLLLEMSRRVPVILQQRSDPTYARVVSYERLSPSSISKVVIHQTDVLGNRIDAQGVPPVNNDSAELADEEDEDPSPVEYECECCTRRQARLELCGNCGDSICDECWYGSCGSCDAEVCASCWEDHDCEGEDDE